MQVGRGKSGKVAVNLHFNANPGCMRMEDSTKKEKVNPNPGQENQSFRGEWIFASLLIGVLSFPVSIYLLTDFFGFLYNKGLVLSDGVLFFSALLIVIILSAFYTYIRKMPAVFILKVSAIATSVLLILITAMIAPLMLGKPSYGSTLWLTKLDYEPEYYVEITPEELEDFPTLQGLNNKSEYGHTIELETTSDEKERLVDLILEKRFKQDDSFETWVSTVALREDEIPAESFPPYFEITAEGLERFPSVKKAVIQPERHYGISSDEWDSFLEFTQAYHKGINGVFIKFENLFYIVRNTEDIRSYVENTASYLKIEGEYYEFRIGLVG